jgi:hypothetical protein
LRLVVVEVGAGIAVIVVDVVGVGAVNIVGVGIAVVVVADVVVGVAILVARIVVDGSILVVGHAAMCMSAGGNAGREDKGEEFAVHDLSRAEVKDGTDAGRAPECLRSGVLLPLATA